MVPTKAALFNLISARMEWLGQRQVILGQNLANADTPDYRPRDLRPDSFKRFVEGATGKRFVEGATGRPTRLSLATTAPEHIQGRASARLSLEGRDQREVFEEAPNGNAVVIEEQAGKLAKTASDYALMTNLYRKHVGMVRTALRGQS